MTDTLINVEGVSKKFCRSLKRSLWYGLQDLGRELRGRRHPLVSELRRDEFWALQDVSFSLSSGEAIGLIGHNGAGKTTLLRILCGLIKPDRGMVTTRGRVQALIALGAGFNPVLTGRENIYINASVLGFTKADIDRRFDEIVEFSGVRDFIEAPVQSYSSGMQVRLGFAVAASLEPDILILDEVLAVGDMQFQAKCWNKLGRLRSKGTAFILVSHQMLNIERLCTTAIYLDRGRISATGNKHSVIERYEADMRSSVASESCATDDKNSDLPAGSGRVAIRGVHFRDANNDVTSALNTGDAVTICVDYVRRCEEICDPILELTVRDSDGLLFQMSNRPIGVRLGCLQSQGRIRVHIPGLPSNNQRLLISVTLWNGDMTELFDWKMRIPLEVKGHSYSTGRAHLQAVWTHLVENDND